MKCAPELSGTCGREMKFPRQYADDDARGVVEYDGLTQDIGLPAVTFLPRGVTEHHGAGRGGQIFSGIEVSSKKRDNAERAKESVADASGAHRLRSSRRAKEESASVVNIERIKDRVALLPIQVIEIGKVALREHFDALEHAR